MTGPFDRREFHFPRAEWPYYRWERFFPALKSWGWGVSAWMCGASHNVKSFGCQSPEGKTWDWNALEKAVYQDNVHAGELRAPRGNGRGFWALKLGYWSSDSDVLVVWWPNDGYMPEMVWSSLEICVREALGRPVRHLDRVEPSLPENMNLAFTRS